MDDPKASGGASLGGGRAYGVVAERRDVGPGEAVGGPEALERLVGGVAEAVAVTEVVQPALPVVVMRVAEAHEPTDAVRVPRHRLRQRELVVGRRLAERRIEAVANAEHQAAEHVGAPRAGQRAWPLG